MKHVQKQETFQGYFTPEVVFLKERIQAEVERLAGLGIEGIRSELSARGIRGRQGIGWSCLLARALLDTLGIKEAALIASSQGILIAEANLFIAFVGRTEIVGRIAVEFDQGRYPELVEWWHPSLGGPEAAGLERPDTSHRT